MRGAYRSWYNVRRHGLMIGVALSLAMAFTPRGSVSAQGGCRVARADSPIGRACAEGGLIKAKQVMRALIKQGRAAGVRHECDDCHTDDDSYDRLTPDAKDKLARLLAAVDRKR